MSATQNASQPATPTLNAAEAGTSASAQQLQRQITTPLTEADHSADCSTHDSAGGTSRSKPSIAGAIATFVIRSRGDDDELIYWSNVDGWGDACDATLFSAGEKSTFDLPNNGTSPVEWISSEDAEGAPRRFKRALVIDVEYEVSANDIYRADAEARGLLLDIAEHASDIGAFSCDSSLTVAHWSAKVEPTFAPMV